MENTEIQGWEIMRALREFNTEAQLKNLRVKEFKLTKEEYALLSSTLSALTSTQHFASWSEKPVFDGVPLRIV